MRQIKRIFVHCTAGPQNQKIEDILNYWKKVRGWKDPGYHYIIKADGEVVQLQPENKPSNGVQGYNSTSINVCYIGGVDKQGRPVDNRTDAQKASLATVLRDLHKRFPNAEIMGHRDIWGSDKSKWKKMCPCFDVKAELDTLLADPIKPIEPIDNHQPVKPETPVNKPITAPDIEHPVIVSQPNTEPRKGIFELIISLLSKIFKK